MRDARLKTSLAKSRLSAPAGPVRPGPRCVDSDDAIEAAETVLVGPPERLIIPSSRIAPAAVVSLAVAVIVAFGLALPLQAFGQQGQTPAVDPVAQEPNAAVDPPVAVEPEDAAESSDEAEEPNAGIDVDYLTRQLEDDVELSVSRSEASRLREQSSEVSQRLSLMRSDVDVLHDRIGELEFAMGNQEVLIEQARLSRRKMAEQRSEITAEMGLLGLEIDGLTELLIQRSIASYMDPSSDTDLALLAADNVVQVEATRALVAIVLDREQEIVDALESRSAAMDENEYILEQLAEHASRTHDAETRAQEALTADQAEYQSLLALIGLEIEASEQAYVELNNLADEMDSQIAEREAQLHAIAVRRAERRAECESTGGQVAEDGDDINCSWLGATLAPGSLAPPLFSSVDSGFGMRVHPIDGTERMHEGWDYDASMGTAIGAAGPGEVFFVGWLAGFGKTVIIDHGGGVETLYAHQNETLVAEGTVVATGQTIGVVGSTGRSTGPHLHFEVSVNGAPVDPASFIG